MLDHDMEDLYEHVYAPEGEMGVKDVLVEDHGRVLAVSVIFYDTRDVAQGYHLAQHRAAAMDPLLEEDEDIDDAVSILDHFHGFWKVGEVVADTPAARGIIRELQNLDQWHKKSVAGKACCFGSLMRAFRFLWD